MRHFLIPAVVSLSLPGCMAPAQPRGPSSFSASPTTATPDAPGSSPAGAKISDADEHSATTSASVSPTTQSTDGDEIEADASSSAADGEVVISSADAPWLAFCEDSPRPLDKRSRTELRQFEDALVASLLVKPTEMLQGGPAEIFDVLRNYPATTLSLHLPVDVLIPKTSTQVRLSTARRSREEPNEPTIDVVLKAEGVVGTNNHRALIVYFSFSLAGPPPAPGTWLFGAGGSYCVARLANGELFTAPFGAHWISRR